jgi:hypothetical protein
MTIFPAGFTTTAAVDADDIFLLDGKRKATGAVVKTHAMPVGVVDAADYTAASVSQLVSADATTGFTGSGGHGGATVTLNASIQNEGTGCVGFLMDMDTATPPKFYYTFSSPQAIGTRTLVAFDFRYSKVGPAGFEETQCLEAVVGDSTALGGNTQVLALPSFPQDTWVRLVLPLTGLSAIKSIGIRRSVNTGITNSRSDLFIDNIGFIAETKIDQALGSASSVGVIVGPTYTPDANQLALYLPSGKGLIDPAKGVYSKANNVVQLHDYLAHTTGGETGATDVAATFSRVINAAQPGQTVVGAPGAYYRFDHDVILDGLVGVTIDLTGTTCFLTYQSNTPFMTLDNCQDVTILKPTLLGYKTTTHTGSNMDNVAGTPTISGTTKLLDAQNEEVQLLDDSNWNLPYHWGRVLPHQVGVADDGLGPRNYFVLNMSDSAQVANDWLFTLYDGDTSTVLASSTFTATGSTAAYPLSYFPTDLGKRLRATVKKLTATANTGTVTSITSFGRINYDATYDVASAIILTNSERIKIIEPWSEGFGGDAIQVSDGAVRDVLIVDPTSRACRRQGYSFNRGQDITIVRPIARECGRSGIDIEPFASTWASKRIKIYDAQFYNITNYAYAMSNFARNIDCVLDGADVYEARLGVISGGTRGGVIRNLRNWTVITNPGSADFELKCTNVAISGLVSQDRISCSTNTNTYNDGSGDVTYTPEGNTLSDIHLKNNLGGVKLKLAAGYDIIGPVHDESLTRSDFGATTNAFGPFDTAGRSFANFHFGEYYRQFPNTFKAPFGQSHLFVPGGVDVLNESVSQVRSLSGGSTKGNNLRGINVAVTETLSTLAVTFPTATVGTLSQAILAAGTASSGTLSAATTYYYRLAPRSRLRGPATYLSQISRTTGGAETAILVEVEGWMDSTNDLIVEGFTLLRGVTNGGPYTTRYDFVPNEQLHGPQPNGTFFYDQGSNLVMRDFSNTDAQYGYPQTTAAATGSWDASVNETGYEPDATYGVIVTPNWLTTVQVTSKTVSGFTINFGTPAPANAKVDWFLVR